MGSRYRDWRWMEDECYRLFKYVLYMVANQRGTDPVCGAKQRCLLLNIKILKIYLKIQYKIADSNHIKNRPSLIQWWNPSSISISEIICFFLFPIWSYLAEEMSIWQPWLPTHPHWSQWGRIERDSKVSGITEDGIDQNKYS